VEPELVRVIHIRRAQHHRARRSSDRRDRIGPTKVTVQGKGSGGVSVFGKRAKEDRALTDATAAAVSLWLQRLGELRPVGVSTFTEELFRQVGPIDLSHLTSANPWQRDVGRATTRYMGQEAAARLARQAILASDNDARSRASFWNAVSEWFSNQR
jgi:hypothetical protein